MLHNGKLRVFDPEIMKSILTVSCMSDASQVFCFVLVTLSVYTDRTNSKMMHKNSRVRKMPFYVNI